MTFDKAVTRVFKFDTWHYSLYCADNAQFIEQAEIDENFEIKQW